MKWNSNDMKYENHEKKKKSLTVFKDIEPKDKAKGSTEGGRKKTSQVPHMIHLSVIEIL